MKKTLLSTVLAILISTSAVMAQTAGASVAGVGAATAATNDAVAGSAVAGNVSALAAAGAPVDTATKLKEFCKKCAVDATYTDATMPNLTCDAACN